MLKGVHARGVKRTLAECLVAISILALVTEGCHRLGINVATCALLYVVVVVVISRLASLFTCRHLRLCGLSRKRRRIRRAGLERVEAECDGAQNCGENERGYYGGSASKTRL